MMEKQNRTLDKTARGDSGALDEIVEGAALRFRKVHATDPKRRHELADEPAAEGGRA